MAKQRSPNYPGVDLAEAVSLASKMYEREKQAPFPIESAAAAWDYKGPSGPVRVRLGALRQYDLISREGRNSSRLTNRALTILLRNEASTEHREALRSAALAPALFKELYETRAEASDESLKHYLIVNCGFTDAGASHAIKAFRGTINAAGLIQPDTKSRLNEDTLSEEEENSPYTHTDSTQASTTTVRTDMLTVPLPGGGSWTIPQQVTPVQWEQMQTIFNAYKPIVVQENAGADDPPSALESDT